MGSIIYAISSSIIAIFIAGIWIEYFRMIDLFEKEKLKHIIIQFVFGGLTIIPLLFFYDLIDLFNFKLNGDYLNDFLFCFIKIGVVEEAFKIFPFIAFYLIFKKNFNEPIDYILYISISALGFSAVENIKYFNIYGPEVIDGRSILSTVGHMFDTSIFAYGIIYQKYYKKKRSFIGLLFFFLLAAFSHGFYDFWLLADFSFGWLVTVFYFLYTISIFSIVMNNALNFSPYFTYKKTIDSWKVSKRLLNYYVILFLMKFLMIGFTSTFMSALYDLIGSIFLSGFIIGISCLRLSRFKLIKEHWFLMTLELPFTIKRGDRLGLKSSKLLISIKGETSNESNVTKFYNELFNIQPLSKRNTYIGERRDAYMIEKVFLKNLESFFLVKIFFNDNEFEYFLLKPKTTGEDLVNKQYPIVGILRIVDLNQIEDKMLSGSDFNFIEWAFIYEKKNC